MLNDVSWDADMNFRDRIRIWKNSTLLGFTHFGEKNLGLFKFLCNSFRFFSLKICVCIYFYEIYVCLSYFPLPIYTIPYNQADKSFICKVGPYVFLACFGQVQQVERGTYSCQVRTLLQHQQVNCWPLVVNGEQSGRRNVSCPKTFCVIISCKIHQNLKHE